MTTLRTIAPAKINWTLEVLGRREDGYHEIRSVMQTIDLSDEVWVEKSPVSRFETMEGEALEGGDLIVRAARALEESVGRELPARVRVEKRIPVASGLGGGSSDAAAALRLLNRLYQLGLSDEELASVGATVGSDVPFFVYGGTALIEGRGERVTPLADVPEACLVLWVPPNAPSGKTGVMYAALTEADFRDGSATRAAVEAISKGRVADDWLITNVFEPSAYEEFHDLSEYRYALLSAGARAVYLSGSGPGLFALAKNRGVAAGIAKMVKAGGGKVHIARTLRAEEATAVTD